jgi:D-glycero-alpha-D-manno-heptose-7-phosphate kinase
MYVVLNKRFDKTIRASYTKTEIVDSVDQIQHDLIREAMRLVSLDGGVEITTIADVPAGTGLGSSSSLAVGLLNALYAFTEKFRSAEPLSQEACRIEIDILNEPIGKQDQYAAAYGGLNYIQFNPDETVFVDPIICSKEVKEQLQNRLLLFYTGLQGDNSDILVEQRRETMDNAAKQKFLEQMVELAKQMRNALNNNDLASFGELLHQNWELKKQMASGISNPQIDRWYQAARQAGVLGGKILGAGGRGFLLLCCSEGKRESVQAVMQGLGLREFPFRFEPQGSKIIYVGG